MIAEDAVLGSIIKEPYLINETDLKPEHLTSAVNKSILNAMRKLNGEGKSIDYVSILTAGDPDSFGGASNLTRIQAAANPKKFDDHVEIVMNAWREREKMNILTLSAHENWSVDDITRSLADLTGDRVDDRHKLNDLLAKDFETPWTKQEELRGVPTGLANVDRVTGGWQNSDLIFIAARPSMGKTDVMLEFAKSAGLNGYLPIIFSLEMPAIKLSRRLISSTGRINKGKFKNPEKYLNEEEKKNWQNTLNRVALTEIEIYDKARQTVAEMRMKIRKTMSESPGKKPVIFIDYLTLIKNHKDYNGNMHLQITDIVQDLKSIAKEHECPVICLSQLSRNIEKRDDKRPMMSDLRESGSIEETADVVAFLYRDSYYTKNEEDKELEILFAKNREGETGKVVVYYDTSIGDVVL